MNCVSKYIANVVVVGLMGLNGCRYNEPLCRILSNPLCTRHVKVDSNRKTGDQKRLPLCFEIHDSHCRHNRECKVTPKMTAIINIVGFAGRDGEAAVRTSPQQARS